MTDTTPENRSGGDGIDLRYHATVLVIVTLLVWVGQTIGPAKPLVPGLAALCILFVMTMVGLIITKFAPIKLPSVAWISLVGIIATLPWTPGSDWIVAKVAEADFLALATPCLAYAGLAIAKREMDVAKASGWKIALIAILVMTGTFLGSAVIAELFL